jgi:hypothetical protein
MQQCLHITVYVMIYETYHINMDDPHDVQVSVHSLPCKIKQYNIFRYLNTKKNESGSKI